MVDVRDGAWLLMEHDGATGRSVWMTEQDGNFVFRVGMPLNDIFDQNKEAEAATQGVRFGDWNRVASIPHHLVYQNGVNDAIEQRDNGWLSRYLNDSNNEKWRTSRGRV